MFLPRNVGAPTPEYSSFFPMSATEDTVLHVGERLMLTLGEHIGNGRLFGVGRMVRPLRPREPMGATHLAADGGTEFCLEARRLRLPFA